MDPRRLGQLLEEHGPALVLYARQWTDAPEDVVQEAFLKLVEQARPPVQILPWLYRVVRNAALDGARAEGRRRRHESRAAAQAPSWFLPAETPGMDGEAATAAIAGLPAEEHEVIVLHLWARLSFAEIGGIVGTSTSSAHRRYLTGLERLRERLNVPCPNRPTP